MTDWKSKSAIAHSEAKVVRFSQERIHRQSGLNGLVRLVSKLSDMTCTCLALDPRPDILLTQSARSVGTQVKSYPHRKVFLNTVLQWFWFSKYLGTQVESYK